MIGMKCGRMLVARTSRPSNRIMMIIRVPLGSLHHSMGRSNAVRFSDLRSHDVTRRDFGLTFAPLSLCLLPTLHLLIQLRLRDFIAASWAVGVWSRLIHSRHFTGTRIMQRIAALTGQEAREDVLERAGLEATE